MAGKPGRSGRKPISADLHVLRGTFRKDRHASAAAATVPQSDGVPAPPDGLSDDARAWWLDIATRWQMDVQHLRLLTLAAQAWDDCQTARAELRTAGNTITMPSGAVRPHPAIRREHDARLTFAKLVAQLDLERD